MRLGTLPATRKWQDVVRLIREGADVGAVAEKTLVAAEKALARVSDDAGFREAAHLLVQLAVAGTMKDAAAHLESVGVDLGADASVANLTAALAEAVDRRMDRQGQRTDWGEMSRAALVATVADYLAKRKMPLFEISKEGLTGELKPLGEGRGFGTLARKFMGNLTTKFLRYFLDKTLGSEMGEGKYLATTNNLAGFKQGLERHCDEAAVIVEGYFAGWFNGQKAEATGPTRESAEKAAWFGIEKMRKELGERGRSDGA